MTSDLEVDRDAEISIDHVPGAMVLALSGCLTSAPPEGPQSKIDARSDGGSSSSADGDGRLVDHGVAETGEHEAGEAFGGVALGLPGQRDALAVEGDRHGPGIDGHFHRALAGALGHGGLAERAELEVVLAVTQDLREAGAAIRDGQRV